MTSDRRCLARLAVCLVATWCASGSSPAESQERRATADRDTNAVLPYVYDHEGRRDPFVSLLRGGGGGTRPVGERPLGLAGLAINDLTLRGLVRSQGAYLAVMEAPNRMTYILHGNEHLYDGVVQGVSEAGVVFLQDINDASSLLSEREVLRSLREEKETSP